MVELHGQVRFVPNCDIVALLVLLASLASTLRECTVIAFKRLKLPLPKNAAFRPALTAFRPDISASKYK